MTAAATRVVTVDLGTSAVKAAVWSPDGLVALQRAPVATSHPTAGRAEQDPEDWWRAVTTALRGLPFDGVRALGFSSQRETVVPVDGEGRVLRPALLWSDQRSAGRRSAGLVAWVREHEPALAARTTWWAFPRDWVAWRLTGIAATDPTLAGISGLTPGDLPPVRPSTGILGELTTAVAGLPAGLPVVLGAGDRACEVIGTGASATEPMVSWGTTANVSLPTDDATRGPEYAVAPGALGGWLRECGLSAAGSALAWAAELTGGSVAELTQAAAVSPAGANGVVVLPWLDGARAPWWEPTAQPVVLGRGDSSDLGDLARAVYEGVAHDVRRCLAAIAPEAVALRAAGGGADDPVWRQVLPEVTGLPVIRRTTNEAGSLGAALLTSGAMGLGYDHERLAPIAGIDEPDLSDTAARDQRAARHDAMAHAALGLDG